MKTLWILAALAAVALAPQPARAAALSCAPYNATYARCTGVNDKGIVKTSYVLNATVRYIASQQPPPSVVRYTYTNPNHNYVECYNAIGAYDHAVNSFSYGAAGLAALTLTGVGVIEYLAAQGLLAGAGATLGWSAAFGEVANLYSTEVDADRAMRAACGG